MSRSSLSKAWAFALLLIFCAAPSISRGEVARRVVASGGAAMGSDNFAVSGTAGQTGVGAVSSPNFSAFTGFWFLRNGFATSIDGSPALPRVFALDQNYPNPFNPSTTIPFALPRESFVELGVFDAAGRLVQELVHEVRPAGIYHEPLVATSLASGIYFYRLEASGQIKTRKLVLLK